MALENLDLLVVQKAGGGELRKTTVADLLADAGGGAEVIISDTAPDFAADSLPAGTLWWASDEGDLYILYTDDDSTQWVSATAGSGGGGTLNPPSSDEPTDNSNGDLWVDLGECPPVLKIWSDCEGVGEWFELSGGGPRPIDPNPADVSVPGATGSGTQGDPFVLTFTGNVGVNNSAQSDQTITFSNQTIGNKVEFVDSNAGTNGTRFNQPDGVIGVDGTYSAKLQFTDTGTSSPTTYTGALKVGKSSVYFTADVSVIVLSVAKGSISPSSGATGDTFTGTAAVSGAQNPVETNVFLLDGVEKQSGTSNTYVPTEAGELTYYKSVTDDNGTTVGATSDAVTVTLPPGPTATMRGLRFDGTRKTELRGSATGINSVYTVSFWAKRTQAGDGGLFISQNKNAGTGGLMRIKIDGSNNLRILSPNAEGTEPISGYGFAANIWQHVVVTVDNGTCTVYVNGEEVGSADDWGDTTFNTPLIGKSLSSGGNSENFGGYLSDFYLIDNKVAPPTTFGKSFPGDKWGPLDSSVIQDNLDNLQPADPTPEPGPGAADQPYDSRPNDSQDWTTNTTVSGSANFNGSYPKSNVFNGLDDAGRSTGTNTDMTITFSTPLNFTKSVRAYGNQTGTMQISGGEAVSTSSGGLKWYTLAEGSGTLSTLTLTSTGGDTTSLARIEVDGRQLVDNGLWNIDENWSDYVQSSSGWNAGSPAPNGFNGILDGSAQGTCQGGTGTNPTSLTFTPPGGIDFSDKVEVWVHNSENRVSYNTGGLQSISGSNWTQVSPVPGKLTSLKFERASTNGASFAGIRVDGKILVDSGRQWNTSQVWSNGIVNAPDFLGSNPATNMFDGDPESVTRPSNKGVPIVVNFSNVTVAGSIKVNGGSGGGGTGNMTVTINKDEADEKSFNVSGPADELESGSTTFSGQLKSLTMIDDNNTYPHCGAITIDGKMLVDGTAVWNTSQRWSDQLVVENPSSASDPTKSFDGTITRLEGANAITEDSNPESTITLPVTLNNSTVKIYYGVNTSQSTFKSLTAGDKTVTTASNEVTGFYTSRVEVTGATGNSIAITFERVTGNSSNYIYQIVVDGEVLVDGAPTWNSSQTWSDSLSGNRAEFPAALAFDGDLTTASFTPQPPGGPNTLVFAEALTGVTSFKIQVRPTGASATGEDFTVSGTGLTTTIISSDDQQSLVSIPVTNSSVSDVTVSNVGGGYSAAIAGIEVNGELLVNPGLGEKGFYLPFDPAQTGATYFDKLQLINGASYVTNQGPELAFNGEKVSTLGGTLSTAIVQESSAMLELVFDPAIDIGANSSCFMGASKNGSVLQIIDSSNVQIGADIPIPSGGGTLVDLPASEDVMYLRWNSNGISGDGVGFGYLIINGELLSDHSSIGVDMSGNKNNSYDANFGVGNSTRFWSSETTSTDNTYSVTQLFNGADRGTGTANGIDIKITSLTFNPAISYTEKVEITADGSNFQTNVNSGGNVSLGDGSPKAGARYAIATGSGAISTLSGTTSSGAGWIYSIWVDGVKLIDPPAVDPVLDTPMKNYATLDADNKHMAGDVIRNGNLELFADSSSAGFGQSTVAFSSGKYYAEFVFVEGSTPIQPVIGIRASSSTGYDDSYYYYGTDGQKYINGADPESYGDTYSPGDIVAVAVDMDAGTVAFYKNGVSQGEAFTGVSGSYRIVAGKSGGNHGGFSVNYGQQPYIHTKPAGYEGLYQTWDEYARSSLGYALDRVAQLEALRLADAATIADLRTQIEGALSRIASIEADEINDDAASTVLMNLVASVSSQVNTWSSRIETAEAAIADYETRITTLES